MMPKTANDIMLPFLSEHSGLPSSDEASDPQKAAYDNNEKHKRVFFPFMIFTPLLQVL